MNCRVLKSGKCVITSPYGNRTINGKKEFHNGVDIVKEGYQTDYIVTHSEGKVIDCRDGLGNMKGSNSYGNYVKIDHKNGYYTFYAHLKKGISVKKGQDVKKGQTLAYMGNSGGSYGAHLHFEVWKGNTRINPTPYLNADLPTPKPKPTEKYKVGDTVITNGVFVSSTSDKKYKPAKSKGKITKVVSGARNPYLLDNGNIGWTNDDCIVSKAETKVYKTVTNCNWLNLRTSPSYGNNIYKSVKKGTRLEYLGTTNGWAKVKYEGKTLYCGASYLK